jgi:hypothetical protein
MNESPQFALTLRKLALLFRRDFAVARSYRAAFVIEFSRRCLGPPAFSFYPNSSKVRRLKGRSRPARTIFPSPWWELHSSIT